MFTNNNRQSTNSRVDDFYSRLRIGLGVAVVVIIGILILSREGQQYSGSFTDEDMHIAQRSYATILSSQISSLNCSYLETVNHEVDAVLTKLYNYWDVDHFPNFLTMMHIPARSWDIQKAKFTKLLLEANAKGQGHWASAGKVGSRLNKSYQNDLKSSIPDSVLHELMYVVGFSGSSVTAGHDNYFHEAYPKIFEDALQPVFQAMKVPLVVRNHALGNNPCFPYDACTATHLGDDLDVLTWEQSMNCGRQSLPLDTFSRTSYTMTKKPTLVYISSGGPTWTRQDCANLTSPDVAQSFASSPTTTEGTSASISTGTTTTPTTTAGGNSSSGGSVLFVPRNTPLSTQEQLQLSQTMRANAQVNAYLYQFPFLKDPAPKAAATAGGSGTTSLFLADRFKNLAPMGQSLFGIESYRCLGPYTNDFNEKSPGGGATHHPGKYMHKLRGDSLAFFFLSILQEAVAAVDQLAQCGLVKPSIRTNRAGDPVVGDSNGRNRVSATSRDPKTSSLDGGDGSGSITSSSCGNREQHPSLQLQLEALDSALQLQSSSNFTTQHALGTLPAERPNGQSSTRRRLQQQRQQQQHDTVPFVAMDAARNCRDSSSVESSVPTSSARVYQYIVSYLQFLQTPPLPEVPSSYAMQELSYQPTCYTNLQPHVSHALDSSGIMVPQHSNWTLGLSFLDKKAVVKSQEKGLGYIDLKYIWTSSGVNSSMTFNIHVTHENPLWLCEVQKGFVQYPSHVADLPVGASVYIKLHHRAEPLPNSAYSSPNTSDMLKMGLYAFHLQCYRTNLVPAGEHMLTVVQNSDKLINLAYMVTW